MNEAADNQPLLNEMEKQRGKEIKKGQLKVAIKFDTAKKAKNHHLERTNPIFDSNGIQFWLIANHPRLYN